MTSLSIAELRKLLAYNSETGVFTWLVNRRGGVKAGCRAGYIQKDGYAYISIASRKYFAHRLAWLYAHGQWPKRQIDHINGVRDDNRIANLRECSRQENATNQIRPHADSASGALGVSLDRRSGRWIAQIQVSGKKLYLGSFDSKEKASYRYWRAKRELHPFSTPLKESA